jgi:hypothetical protein
MLERKAGAYPLPFREHPLGWAFSNNTLVCKGLPGTNTLTYIVHSKVKKKRSFVHAALGTNVIKLSIALIYDFL